ncbi:actin-related protein 2/3 complex subunit 5-B [Strongylocentrotus purpuratus]|uniref:Actin-related protein 2/3 complex subunit 5 n=1 Tax=Strongylocentrotus purpuratus TaxID=7668 RepID=A0A7M7LL10_STRPU|nr:actin-related protein 2/3 complex subunit 5-B [Strongylocentrotus purpuratus]|eukprot:XP_001198802.2 PREDICTED: actin-related protein 2/3 complex subunit 5-like protein [Strongylocentrotus purpuratus]
MSKSTSTTIFRKVNIDEFDENNYQDEVVEADQVAVPAEEEIERLLNSKKNVDALQLLLRNAPITSKNQVDKDKAHQLVIRVLTMFKASEVGDAVNSLDSNSIDILMKYIYREFAAPSEKSASVCLTWHEKVYAVGGVGSIIRVLTDRKGV